MPHASEQHTDWRRVLSGSAAGPTAAPRWAPPAEVEAAPLAVTEAIRSWRWSTNGSRFMKPGARRSAIITVVS